ncbi:MAG: hypothetical protein GY946_31180 [bacterium]|nr:hypothetical protein [bacterium]
MINPDFKDLLLAFNAAEVRYLVVGAYAVTFHAQPRFTKDLDLWVEASPENAARVHKALTAFGAPIGELTVDDLANPEMVYQIGVAPNRIDVLMGVSGLGFSEAWPERVDSTYGDCPIHVISRQDLIRNKRAAGRPQDLIDLRALGEDIE